MIPEKVEQKLLEVFAYANEVEDWITVKKELVRHLPSPLRSLFSRRHPITKVQQTNEFELEIIKRWSELGGKDLYI